MGGVEQKAKTFFLSLPDIYWLYANVLDRGNVNVQVEKKRTFKLGKKKSNSDIGILERGRKIWK